MVCNMYFQYFTYKYCTRRWIS